MTGFFRHRKIIFSGLLPSLAVEEIDLNKFKEIEGLYIADPWERVKSILTVDDYGNLHPELVYAFHMTQIGAFSGAVFGGLYQAVKDTNKFFRINDTQIFENAKQANRALAQVNILSFGKGACKWAPSFALFCGGFTLISSCCELYFNDHRVINYTIAGSSVGSLFKFSFGIKGMISGGIVGGLLGSVYGLALSAAYKISNTNHIKFKYAHFAYAQYKKQSAVHKSPSQSIYDNPSLLTNFNASNKSEDNENSVQKNEKI